MFKQWFARLRQSRQDERQQLWLVSFIILFFELALIRFIPAYVRYLGYFTNFILLGAFLGIGIGCLLTKQKRDFWAIFAPLFVLLILLIKIFKFEVQITTEQVIYFKSNTENSLVESYLLLPSIFLVVTLLFATLAQKLGKLLTRFPPLTAYTFDILGSISGILLFTLGSFLNLPITLGFGIFIVGYLWLSEWRLNRMLLSACLLVFALYLVSTLDTLPTIWSPYYKIAPYSVSNPARELGQPDIDWRLYVNNISHQEMTDYEHVAPFYKLIYEVLPNQKFAQVLVVGAGSGQDVNVALKNGVGSVDAVEIDPVIADLGKKLHPERPYADQKVKLIINDARSFLENTQKRYDLVIFALPDSAVLATSLSSLRLESYLFTLEAFDEAKTHLTENGIFVLYNYYRTSWLVDKMAQMLRTSFGKQPYVVHYEDNLAIFMVGAKLAPVPQPPMKIWSKTQATLYPATDDWPFLYLKDVTIPKIYIKSLGVIFLIALGLTLLASRGQIVTRFAGDFFFLGAAFLLLETKSIVNFNLLFGSTWLVNSLVFVGMLISVLLAIWVNQKWQIKRLTGWIVLLIIALFANYVLPVSKFLLPNFWLRYVVATAFFFSPIFLANIIFSSLFKRAKHPADNFGINLLGAFFGGMFEYTSLLWGYHNLILVAIIFYALAGFFILRRISEA
ncbi:hypothetical protein A3A59_05175 [Candidatus Gottesmanbacteria bacterium RIFCSPLOWO2_01_FULL_42_10]|nr:MAG: hypothetical protein A3A59_05175 [Candidatus Gottesmanbacteria bacterium RIFCSPLOWO2_01_FULL_42_10]